MIRYVVSGWKDGDFFLNNFQLISIFSYAKSQNKKIIQIPELVPKNNKRFQILDYSSPSLGKSATRLSTFRDNYKTDTQILYPDNHGFQKAEFLVQFVLRTITVTLKKTLSRYNGDPIKK